jgi:hypothetical protein
VSGYLTSNIISKIKNEFKKNCVQLLYESYASALGSQKDFREKTENEVTVMLIGFMKQNPKSNLLRIDITREFYLDSEETYAGEVNPDASPRIDIRFMNWTNPDKTEYFIESKNVCETNWVKSETGATIDAHKLHKRYIDTGIQNFINGRYPMGCIVGYVMQGDPDKIVDKINLILLKSKRELEQLSPIAGEELKKEFLSKHANSSIADLHHYFLCFN